MPRLIYADEAKENACKWECGGDPSCPYSKSNGITHEQCEFMRAIDECRTIDAVPVKHGHWIYKWNPYFKQELPYCSVCEKVSPSVSKTDYCSHCGAVMDEVTE